MKLTNVSFAYGDKVILTISRWSCRTKASRRWPDPPGAAKPPCSACWPGWRPPRAAPLTPPWLTPPCSFREDRLLPGLTAAGQIGVVLPKGESSMPWLEAVGLADASMLLPKELSGGMRRRVALARCLAYGQRKSSCCWTSPLPASTRSVAAVLWHSSANGSSRPVLRP